MASILLNNKYKNKSPLVGNDTYGLLSQPKKSSVTIENVVTNPWGKSAVDNNKKLQNTIAAQAGDSKIKAPSNSTDSSLKSYTNSGSGGSGGGTVTTSNYETTVKPYLDAMVAAYGQGADANRATALSTYNATINNLNDILKQAQQGYDITLRDAEQALQRAQESYDTGAANAREDYSITEGNLRRALERFQAQNAKSVENQRKSYLTDQAALESARLEADRQTRIDAAARGLGGSGLQQLAQLQNLLNQGQDISNLATENQGVLDKLRTQLIEAEEDTASDISEAARKRDNTLNSLLTALNTTKAEHTDRVADALQVLQNAQATNKTKLQDALEAYNASVQGIDANLANQVANAYYSYGQDKYSADQAAASARNSYAAQSAANDVINAQLAYLQDDLSSNLNSLNTASKKTLKSLRDTYGLGSDASKTDIANAMVNSTLGFGANTGLNSSQYNTFSNNLNTILKNANVQNDKSFWEKLTGK